MIKIDVLCVYVLFSEETAGVELQEGTTCMSEVLHFEASF